MFKIRRYLILTLLIGGVLLVGVSLGATAQEDISEPPEQTTTSTGSPLHPAFPLLDSDGENVLESGNPLSTMKTCGSCHDTGFIAKHSFHADVGLGSFGEAGNHAWDTSPGYFGRWNSITYRYLSAMGDEIIDLTTPEWIMLFGNRHVGGGPAVTGREGQPLTDLSAEPGSPETNILDPETGELNPWDWEASGTVEMNCFLCHIADPDNEARITALQSGEFAWSSSATLTAKGIIQHTAAGWQWNAAAFDADGQLRSEFAGIQDPESNNCGQCHGAVHVDAQTPLTLETCNTGTWSTITTGQIISPQRIASSGLSFLNKDDLSRTWDVHAERVVECTDCHYALNNPVYYQEDEANRPEHLTFDPRRMDLGDYLYRPLHEFAKGQSTQSTLAPEYSNTLRRCESCHSIDNTHDWLPYKERHTDALACESCHVPQMYAPALQSVDWTVLTSDTAPLRYYRGLETSCGPDISTILITGFSPVLLPRESADGSTELAPHNLITSWYWVYGNEESTRPVPQRYLEAAWFDGDNYAAGVIELFDADEDSSLSSSELILDSEAKTQFIAGRLANQGLENPRIVGEVMPYSINHNVTHGDWAIRDCQTCHSDDSRVTEAMLLTDYSPGGSTPDLLDTPSTRWNGDISIDSEGSLYFTPQSNSDVTALYILGHDRARWGDWTGILFLLGTMIGVILHGGLRIVSARNHVRHKPELRRVYMYSVYERQWHWLQSAVIFGLLITGLIIHKPDYFTIFSFPYVVQVHNALALILVINAALAAFYHLASGEIRQFLPEPHGLFNHAFLQARYYLYGIFKGEAHPFEKSRQHKMNPIQQMTYMVILNILLPLQIITGAVTWGAQKFPETAEGLGGLTVVTPIHSLVAWLFVSFIILHVYMTTTGPTPLANIRAMMMGWDDVETQKSLVKEIS